MIPLPAANRKGIAVSRCVGITEIASKAPERANQTYFKISVILLVKDHGLGMVGT